VTVLEAGRPPTPPPLRPLSRRAAWALRAVGSASVVTVALTVWLGLWVTPPDQTQGNLVRLVYLHPPVAWVALYLAFGVAALSSLLWLWPRTRSAFWDRLAASAVEVGTVNFWDPCASETLVDSLEKWCLEHRIEKLSELTGGLKLD